MSGQVVMMEACITIFASLLSFLEERHANAGSLLFLVQPLLIVGTSAIDTSLAAGILARTVEILDAWSVKLFT